MGQNEALRLCCCYFVQAEEVAMRGEEGCMGGKGYSPLLITGSNTTTKALTNLFVNNTITMVLVQQSLMELPPLGWTPPFARTFSRWRYYFSLLAIQCMI